MILKVYVFTGVNYFMYMSSLNSCNSKTGPCNKKQPTDGECNTVAEGNDGNKDYNTPICHSQSHSHSEPKVLCSPVSILTLG